MPTSKDIVHRDGSLSPCRNRPRLRLRQALLDGSGHRGRFRGPTWMALTSKVSSLFPILTGVPWGPLLWIWSGTRYTGEFLASAPSIDPIHTPAPRWLEIFRSNLDGSQVKEDLLRDFGVEGYSPAQTSIALYIPHPTSISTPDTTPTIPNHQRAYPPISPTPSTPAPKSPIASPHPRPQYG